MGNWIDPQQLRRVRSLVMIEMQVNWMSYTVILEREADGGYVATVPALPGCVSQGDTRDDVMKNICEAADFYIEDCIAAGDPVPNEVGREYFELKTGTHYARVVVPDHKQLRPGTLRQILSEAGIAVEELLKLR